MMMMMMMMKTVTKAIIALRKDNVDCETKRMKKQKKQKPAGI